ncbi:MAG: hypothetical protein AB7S75_13430 [Desulfococcaceae bacterium]
MNHDIRCELLAQRTADIFRCGLHADSDIVHYIRSVFSDPSLPELADILTDDDNAENGPLTELIFFPDENMQAGLENILEQESYEENDRERILRYLYREPVKAKIIFPDMGELRMAVPRWAAEGFIRRLSISKKSDCRIIRAIEKYVPADFRNIFKVRVRNSRFAQNGKNTAFLCHFLEKTEMNLPEDVDMFDYVLCFLDQIRESDQIYRALMDKKKSCFRCLEENTRFEQQLGRGNMEILLLQGIRPPQMTRDAALKEMSLIDRISYAVFGRSEDMEPAFVSSEIMEEPDMAELIRKLS